MSESSEKDTNKVMMTGAESGAIPARVMELDLRQTVANSYLNLSEFNVSSGNSSVRRTRILMGSGEISFGWVATGAVLLYIMFNAGATLIGFLVVGCEERIRRGRKVGPEQVRKKEEIYYMEEEEEVFDKELYGKNFILRKREEEADGGGESLELGLVEIHQEDDGRGGSGGRVLVNVMPATALTRTCQNREGPEEAEESDFQAVLDRRRRRRKGSCYCESSISPLPKVVGEDEEVDNIS